MSSPLPMETTEPTLSVAERFYARQKQRVLDWQRKNPEKCRERAQRYFVKMREERPERYEEYKRHNREALALRRVAKKQLADSVPDGDVSPP